LALVTSLPDNRDVIAFDLPLGLNPEDPGLLAAQAEALGIDGVWSTEAGHDPYLPLGAVATSTKTITLGTAIAVAFPRSPMVHAQVAWDLHRAAPGRFVLGLGPQVRAHNERRYGVAGDKPAARMRDMIGAVRAIWRCWEEGEKLDYRGEFYQHTLMSPFFNPGSVGHGYPRILVAAVSELMLKVAGGHGDGVHVHPLHTKKYLDEMVIPTARGAATAVEHDAAKLDFVVPVMIATGSSDEEMEAAKQTYRSQIAFYASTPAYRGVLDMHGRGDIADQLHGLSRRGAWAEMPALIDDGLIEEICICAKQGDVAHRLVERYAGRATRIMPYATLDGSTPWGEIAQQLRELTPPTADVPTTA
jgi:probable F420-dependent oxidoreductase